MSLALINISRFIPHNEQLALESIMQTKEAVVAILSSKGKGTEVPKFETMQYVATVLKYYGTAAADLVGPIMGILENHLGRFGRLKLQHRKEVLIKVCCLVASLGCPQIIPAVTSVLVENMTEAKGESVLKCLRYAAKILEPAAFVELYNRTLALAGSTIHIDVCGHCFRTLGKFLRTIESGEVLAAVIEQSLGIYQAFCQGNIRVLGGKNIFNNDDIDSELLDGFHCFLAGLVKHKTPAADNICLEMLKLMGRSETIYHDITLQIVIDALENDSISDPVKQKLLEQLPPVFATSQSTTRQNIVYTLLLLLESNPAFMQIIQQVFPRLLEWWTFCVNNKDVMPEVMVNLASLFLIIEFQNRGNSS